MNQNIWGPHLWFSLHTISFTYPLKPTKSDMNDYKIFYESLQNVIPCNICKKNYIRHLKEHPIDPHLNNRKDLVYWVIDMHNMVNAETGKKILSYDNVLKKYELVHKRKINLNIEEHDDEEEYNIKSDILLMNNNDKNNNLNINNKYVNVINIIFLFFIILLIINLIYIMFYSKKFFNK
jgi:hypothetical protein